VIRPPLEEIRRAILHVHARRPLWATWEISRYLHNLGWSNVTTDLVRTILPPPGMPIPGTESPAVLRRRAKTRPNKAWVGPKTRKAMRQDASASHSSHKTESDAVAPPKTHQPLPELSSNAAEFCPSCGVRISVLGYCRCS
jgi:hypothetical protein